MAAKLKGLRRATKLSFGHREIKMLAPECDICNSGPDVPRGWYQTCPHEPYVGTRTETDRVREYEDVLDDEGNPTGERVVKGYTETTVEKPWPNIRQVSLTMRHNGGRGVERQRAKGWILPDEVRCEAYPDGIEPMCQYRGCFSQDGLKVYPNGVFCREMESALVYEDEHGKTIEVLHAERRDDQVAEALSRVRV